MLRSIRPRRAIQAMLPALLIAGCGKPVIQAQFLPPPAADLAVKPQPVMPDAAITDDHASALYWSSVLAWGQDGWASVARLCRWAKANGMAVECPPAP